MPDLLKRYLQMYWLKPFDAVNDAANARALLGFPWQEPILEIGGGDGAFSFIMHGGEFAPGDDRYDQVDPSRQGDMFDVHDGARTPRVNRPASLRYQVGVDLKLSHLLKCKSTGLYKHLVQAAPAPLPLRTNSFRTVFLYFPHGLIERGARLNYQATLAEIRRVLHPDGVLLMLAMNENVRSAFVCHPLAGLLERAGWTRAARYFRRLDAGRCDEIGGVALSLGAWNSLLTQSGFELLAATTQVSQLAWRMYDVQTRPFLRSLIAMNRHAHRAGVKPVIKMLSVTAWAPVLRLWYWLFARPRRASLDTASTGMVFAFKAATR